MLRAFKNVDSMVNVLMYDEPTCREVVYMEINMIREGNCAYNQNRRKNMLFSGKLMFQSRLKAVNE